MPGKQLFGNLPTLHTLQSAKVAFHVFVRHGGAHDFNALYALHGESYFKVLFPQLLSQSLPDILRIHGVNCVAERTDYVLCGGVRLFPGFPHIHPAGIYLYCDFVAIPKHLHRRAVGS